MNELWLAHATRVCEPGGFGRRLLPTVTTGSPATSTFNPELRTTLDPEI